MAIVDSGSTPFQAYARLISILGDQLISDKWVGVIELVKNSYDADAEVVKVKFLNFDQSSKELATIIIEDDGEGMTLDTVLDVWMKPATPNKLNQKKTGDTRFTKKGRVMQGDKGVGRFAIYKLGDDVTLHTKTSSTSEVKLSLNFHHYADDEMEESDHEDKFLDEILNDWEVHDEPEEILNKKNQGTKIVIRDIRNTWKENDLNKLLKAFYRMMPPVLPGSKEILKDFEASVYWNGELRKPNFKSFDEIIKLAPFFFEGLIEEDGTIDFNYKHNKKEVSGSFNLFTDEESIVKYNIWSLKFFREIFLGKIDPSKKSTKDNLRVVHTPSSGKLLFFFYSFDWKNPVEGLKEDEKKFLQENSVYLYRDNVRVFPYGERGIDWLMLSKLRAEDKAGHYFSYNDLIGFVFISQYDNPKLRDAADREGLMNIDGTYDDFVALIQAALKIMKDEVEIDKGKAELSKQKAIKSLNEKYQQTFDDLNKKLSQYDDKELLDRSKKFFLATNSLITKVRDDLKITQELAGTGMAVEKATHDTMSLLKRLRENTEDFVAKFDKGEINPQELREFLIELEENLQFLYQELQVLQPLFRVARKVTKNVSVKNVAERVLKYFRKELSGRIEVEIPKNQDIIVKTNTGLILQVILNLMDNSIYWLNQTSSPERKIRIELDEISGTLIFADSGPGIDEEIKELIFTEFYSKKSEGRGLGLYIVKELLDRIDAEISIITEDSLKILKGANFLIKFKPETKD